MIGPSIGIVMGVFDLFYICNTRPNRSVPSWPTMCFSSYSSEPFELRQILHSRIRRRKGTKPTWFRHYSDKNHDFFFQKKKIMIFEVFDFFASGREWGPDQDPIPFLKPPVLHSITGLHHGTSQLSTSHLGAQ